jgi:histidinol-phosphate/aromatic aminotransferase/cobyric acid decarboxylase-like protein
MPDLGVWLRLQGSQVNMLPELPNDPINLLETERPALIHIERPDRTGKLTSVIDIVKIASAAASMGITVIIDEASANYLGPQCSCFYSVSTMSNVLLLRGLSKGCAAGGLRAGFAIAQPRLTSDLREHLAPLQISALSLHFAARVLSAGDIFRKLRARVRDIKPGFVSRLVQAGLDVDPGHPELPWIVAPRDDSSERLLTNARILWRALDGDKPLLRLAVPLSDARLQHLYNNLGNL